MNDGRILSLLVVALAALGSSVKRGSFAVRDEVLVTLPVDYAQYGQDALDIPVLVSSWYPLVVWDFKDANDRSSLGELGRDIDGWLAEEARFRGAV
jgi:hypothetical protein